MLNWWGSNINHSKIPSRNKGEIAMVRFTADAPDGKTLIGLGLSAENVKRLIAGAPISFDGKDIGLPMLDFLILFGTTEEDIGRMLKPYANKETTVEGPEKEKSSLILPP
jgi:hypothetical protein